MLLLDKQRQFDCEEDEESLDVIELKRKFEALATTVETISQKSIKTESDVRDMRNKVELVVRK